MCVKERESVSGSERERVCERMKTLVLLTRNERNKCVCVRGG